ncbi:hypothetical protein [Pengzhenrongella sicca]|uniref:Uncharacterized protein n=1 Tax=Pengzhenrongella sicca TaxID=2819238 RepID=A0A8A4ZH27_9MICO|nr:hypothetical protein [Pengzhenrongella sicca]QTE30289.1 hypothetical protein J4E96_04605 [Pengzhenrongella sicca]
MRWEALFADLEAQLEAALAADRAAEISELTRAERATVLLADRLRSARGADVALLVAGGATIAGELVDLGADWALVGDGGRRALVPLQAVIAVRGLPVRAAPAPGAVARRLGLGSVLRALSRDRATVRLATEWAELAGRIELVGADHLDLVTGVDAPRSGAPMWTVPFAALRVVRSD